MRENPYGFILLPVIWCFGFALCFSPALHSTVDIKQKGGKDININKTAYDSSGSG